jgi:hypothetical protein
MRGPFSVRLNRGLVCFVILALESRAALAHNQKGEAIGFLTGFKHPISGLDHVLAMVAVGLTAGHTGTLSATATCGLAVTFTSTTTWICTVSGSTVTGVAAGSCAIAANQAGNAKQTSECEHPFTFPREYYGNPAALPKCPGANTCRDQRQRAEMAVRLDLS